MSILCYNVIIWPTEPTNTLYYVILKWSLTLIFINKSDFKHSAFYCLWKFGTSTWCSLTMSQPKMTYFLTERCKHDLICWQGFIGKYQFRYMVHCSCRTNGAFFYKSVCKITCDINRTSFLKMGQLKKTSTKHAVWHN